MKPALVEDVMIEQAQLHGFCEAVRLLVERRLDYGTALDLVRIDLDDAPGFLASPRFPLETHVQLRKLRETLASLASAERAPE